MKTFQSSVEATEFMDKLEEMIRDPRLKEWASITDRNFGTDTAWKLKLLQEASQELFAEMDSAS